MDLKKQIDQLSCKTEPFIHKTYSQKSTQLGSSTSIEQNIDEKHITIGKFLSQKIIDPLQTNFKKFSKFHSTTSNGDKTIRMITALIKIIKAYSLIKNAATLKGVSKFGSQLSLTRRVFRFNSKWKTSKQIFQIVTQKEKSGMDHFNIWFSLFQLVCDINQMFLFFLDIKACRDKWKVHQKLDRFGCDSYVVQILISLGLHLTQYTSMRKQYKKQKNPEHLIKHKKKILTIIKYLCDFLTAHNEFSWRLFKLDQKVTSLAGCLSSLIGLVLAWK